MRTSDESFVRLLPWLMLVAAVTFSFGGRLTAMGAVMAQALEPVNRAIASDGRRS